MDHVQPPTTMQMLPQELAERILLQLDDDVPSLSSCTLVSRVWAAVSYPIRFRRVAFTAQAAVDEANSEPRAFEDFLHILRQSPRLAQCIRELTLRSKSPAGGLDVSTLRSMVCLLPHLSDLTLCVSSMHSPQATLPPLLRRTRLRKLVVREACLWISQDALASTLDLFDEIGELIHHVSATPSRGEISLSTASTRKLRVRSLAFVHGCKAVMAEAIENCLAVYSHLLDPESITAFAIEPGHLSAHELRFYSRFLGRISRNLSEFRCGVFRCGPATEGLDILCNISPDADVRAVHYSVGLEFSWWFQRMITCGWDSAVRGLLWAPTSVRTMELTFKTREGFFSSMKGCAMGPRAGLLALLRALDWSCFESVVNGHPCLERLVIGINFAALHKGAADEEGFNQECQKVIEGRLKTNSRVKRVLQVAAL